MHWTMKMNTSIRLSKSYANQNKRLQTRFKIDQQTHQLYQKGFVTEISYVV